MNRFFATLMAAGLAIGGMLISAPGAQAGDECNGDFTENGNIVRIESVRTTVLGGGEWEGVHEENTDAWVQYRGWTNILQLLTAIEEGDPGNAVTPDDGSPATVEAGTGQGVTYCSDGTLDDAQDALPVPNNPSGDCDGGEADAKFATPVPGVTVGLLAPNGTTGVYDKNTGGHAEIYGWVDPADALEAVVVDGDPERAVEPDDERYPVTVEADTGQGVTYCSNATLEAIQNLP